MNTATGDILGTQKKNCKSVKKGKLIERADARGKVRQRGAGAHIKNSQNRSIITKSSVKTTCWKTAGKEKVVE